MGYGIIWTCWSKFDITVSWVQWSSEGHFNDKEPHNSHTKIILTSHRVSPLLRGTTVNLNSKVKWAVFDHYTRAMVMQIRFSCPFVDLHILFVFCSLSFIFSLHRNCAEPDGIHINTNKLSGWAKNLNRIYK
jgi:hypothetical protein